MILDVVPISKSGNIALYPTLAMNNQGGLGIAWYEYGSPYDTERSDVWHSLQGVSGSWSDPKNVSGGISYNNGPSLVWNHKRGNWICAWHSWRPPGREPFIVNGDVTNIWRTEISRGGLVLPPEMAFSSVSNTEYASLAEGTDEGLQLLYQDRALRLQCLTCSHGRKDFPPGLCLPNGLGAGQHGDIAINSDGVTWITYVGTDGGIFLAAKDRDDRWGEPRCVSEGIEAVLTRPKLSFCPEGTAWVSCHSNTWGSRISRYRVRSASSYLTIQFESDGSPGNHCWTCNAIFVRGGALELSFSFGPDVFGLPPRFAAVTREESLYSPGRGYGFESQPRSQLRKLGDDLTRGVFYDNLPGQFRIDIPAGEYEVEIVYSSWVAPAAGTRVKFDAEVLTSTLPKETRDSVFLLQISPDGHVNVMQVSNGEGCDENRPSKVIHDARTGLKHLAWTSYGPQNVGIHYASFVTP